MQPKLFCPLCRNVDRGEGVWSTVQRQENSDSLAWRYDCSRCGTFYVTQELLDDNSDGFNQMVGIRLSGIARVAAVKSLLVTTENFRDLSDGAPIPRSPGGYFDRVLMEIAAECRWPGGYAQVLTKPLAARCFLPLLNAIIVIKQLVERNLLHPQHDGFAQEFNGTLTIEGWARVEELQQQRQISRRAFVAMWFDKSMGSAYTAIEGVLLRAGYEPPFRVDDRRHDALPAKQQHAKIDDRIIAEIRQSRFVIADFTGNRQAVYYEAGYAMGRDIPVIWCCRKSDLKKLSFDTRQIEHIPWEDPADLASQLDAKIGAKGWRWTSSK